jgi:HK97 family phage portal protein
LGGDAWSTARFQVFAVRRWSWLWRRLSLSMVQLVEQARESGLVVVEQRTGGPVIAAATDASIVAPQPWAGWPADWQTPNWWGRVEMATDIAWAGLDLNASVLSTMPPYLVGAAPSLNADWIRNPSPDIYNGWIGFAKQLFWDYQNGEAFVLATARYRDGLGYPARFHVVPPWMVNVELDRAGMCRYSIGERDVTADMLHIKYQWHVGDTRGRGPLEAGSTRVVAANALMRYVSQLAQAGAVPPAVIKSPRPIGKEQAEDLQRSWVEARMSRMGMPAVLAGGLEYELLSYSPKDLGLVELAQTLESRIAVLLGVPPFLLGLPSGGDSLTYSTTVQLFDYHWRAGLKPKASTVMEELSDWLLPRGTSIELNRDEYVRPGPYERAQTEEIWLRTGVFGLEQIQEIERSINTASAAPSPLTSGVLE